VSNYADAPTEAQLMVKFKPDHFSPYEPWLYLLGFGDGIVLVGRGHTMASCSERALEALDEHLAEHLCRRQ
jgi:hypothetical protein